MKIKHKIAVGTLVQYVFSSGDLDFSFGGSNRMLKGIMAHQKIQKSRPDGYSPEVSVTWEMETDQCILSISGRIDGILTEKETIVVEEIKTTTRRLSDFEKSPDPCHWGQVKIYGFIYAKQHCLNTIMLRLTYYHLESKQTLELDQPFTLDELECFFMEVTGNYLKWANVVSQWQTQRDQSAKSITFPFSSFRPGQRTMAVEVFKTIRDGEQLIVQAATGIGKTMAVIFAAIKAGSIKQVGKLFFLTARTTGRKAAEKAFEILDIKGLSFKTITLTAKDKICFNPEFACTPDECPYAKGHFDRVNDAVGHIFNRNRFTRKYIENTAKKFRVCPFAFSLDLCLWADCIICDYNYAFDPRVYLRSLFNEDAGSHTFLIDEAHNLVDRAREMFSASIHKKSFLALRRKLKKELPHVHKQLGKINRWMLEARKTKLSGTTDFDEKALPVTLLPHLSLFLVMTEKWLSKNIKTSFRDSLMDLYFSVNAFIRVAELYGKTYTTYYEQKDTDLLLKLFCIDPSENLASALKRCSACIFFSATMIPASYFEKILGCSPQVNKFAVPSPFPPENLGVFLATYISTYFTDRTKSAQQVVKAIADFVENNRGNNMIYFPSYDYLEMIRSLFSDRMPSIETISQKPEMTEAERDQFLQKFSGQNKKPLAGFAVMGGIFGEGIDLVGKKLSGAVIVGVGLPAICKERNIIRKYFGTNKVGFEFAYVYPGINRVLQASGRVIRSAKDRGAVLLIDRRFNSPLYRSMLPPHWNSHFISNGDHLEKGIKKFWEQETSYKNG